MTDSPPDGDAVDDAADAVEAELEESGFAANLPRSWLPRCGWMSSTPIRLYVARENWVDALRWLATRPDLPSSAWLSAVDWSTEVAVGEEVAEPDELIDRYEVVCRLSSVTSHAALTSSPRSRRTTPSSTRSCPLFGGAEWHEREAAEMFGITFVGHPYPLKLYLPDRSRASRCASPTRCCPER